MIKAIFFDMGGVICEEGLKPSFKKYSDEFGVPVEAVYDAVHEHQGWKDFTLGNISEEDFLEMCRKRMPPPYVFGGKRYAEIVDELTAPNQKVINLIKGKLAKKYIIGIVSNQPKEWFERFLKKIGLSDIINVAVGSCYEHVRKPSVKIFQAALNQAKVKPDEAIYIDDRDDMLRQAQEMGIKTIVFTGDVSALESTIKQFV